MIDCKKSAKLFSDYYEGLLSPSAAANLKSHLDICKNCRADYAHFEHAMKLLSIPATSADAPASLRASVMARVSQMPAPKDRNVLFQLLSSLSYNKKRTSYALAAVCSAAIVVTAVFDHSLNSHSTRIGEMIPVISAPRAIPEPDKTLPSVPSSAFKSTTIQSSDDKTVYNLALHLPSAISSGSMKAYVLKNDDILSDNQLFSTDADASLAWQSAGLLKNSDLVTIPVAVPFSKDQTASALMFLIQSQSASSNDFAEDLAIEPYGDAPKASIIPAGTSLIDLLKTICSAQNKQIYIDSEALDALQDAHFTLQSDTSAQASLDEILRSISGIAVDSSNPNSIYITPSN